MQVKIWFQNRRSKVKKLMKQDPNAESRDGDEDSDDQNEVEAEEDMEAAEEDSKDVKQRKPKRASSSDSSLTLAGRCNSTSANSTGDFYSAEDSKHQGSDKICHKLECEETEVKMGEQEDESEKLDSNLYIGQQHHHFERRCMNESSQDYNLGHFLSSANQRYKNGYNSDLSGSSEHPLGSNFSSLVHHSHYPHHFSGFESHGFYSKSQDYPRFNSSHGPLYSHHFSQYQSNLFNPLNSRAKIQGLVPSPSDQFYFSSDFQESKESFNVSPGPGRISRPPLTPNQSPQSATFQPCFQGHHFDYNQPTNNVPSVRDCEANQVVQGSNPISGGYAPHAGELQSPTVYPLYNTWPYAPQSGLFPPSQSTVLTWFNLKKNSFPLILF